MSGTDIAYGASVDAGSIMLHWSRAFASDSEWTFYNGKESLGMDIACPVDSAISLRACYAVPGTERAYGDTRAALCRS
eukprot:157564-Rhodomonas_salina.9